MPDKYVKLDDVIEALEHEWGYEGMREDLYNLPTADVAEVKHGYWTRHEFVAKQAGYSVMLYRHAECEKNPCRLFEAMNDYCPNCGAKMDGKKVE